LDVVKGLLFGNSNVVDNSKHSSASTQVFGQSLGLILVCEICLDEDAWEASRGTASNAYNRPTLFGKASAEARPIPFDAPITIDLLIASTVNASGVDPREINGHHQSTHPIVSTASLLLLLLLLRR
jgi:hypothetical protein